MSLRGGFGGSVMLWSLLARRCLERRMGGVWRGRIDLGEVVSKSGLDRTGIVAGRFARKFVRTVLGLRGQWWVMLSVEPFVSPFVVPSVSC